MGARQLVDIINLTRLHHFHPHRTSPPYPYLDILSPAEWEQIQQNQVAELEDGGW
jgi:hypothetical protein